MTNDLDLITAVVKAAGHPGYVLVGPAERVWRRSEIGRRGIIEIERVPDYEDGAVHQLLSQGLLHVGGRHQMTYRGREGPGNAILVPRKTRDMVLRWNSCIRPSATDPKRHTLTP